MLSYAASLKLSSAVEASETIDFLSEEFTKGMKTVMVCEVFRLAILILNAILRPILPSTSLWGCQCNTNSHWLSHVQYEFDSEILAHREYGFVHSVFGA